MTGTASHRVSKSHLTAVPAIASVVAASFVLLEWVAVRIRMIINIGYKLHVIMSLYLFSTILIQETHIPNLNNRKSLLTYHAYTLSSRTIKFHIYGCGTFILKASHFPILHAFLSEWIKSIKWSRNSYGNKTMHISSR